MIIPTQMSAQFVLTISHNEPYAKSLQRQKCAAFAKLMLAFDSCTGPPSIPALICSRLQLATQLWHGHWRQRCLLCGEPDRHFLYEMRFEIDLRDKHRLVGIRLAGLMLRVGDPIVTAGHLLQPEREHVETVLSQPQAKEVVVRPDSEGTEGVVSVHPGAKACNQHVQTEQRATGSFLPPTSPMRLAAKTESPAKEAESRYRLRRVLATEAKRSEADHPI